MPILSATTILIIILAYFALLFIISWQTGKSESNKTFFLADKAAPWYAVAFGMIGTSLSGVTFISVPGWVAGSSFSYMQVVLGYFVGYVIIAYVLLPIYYKMGVVSIYKYLEDRFGTAAHKTGSFYFLLSRVIGASFRLYLVATVLQLFVFSEFGLGFEWSVVISILFIWLYTFRGGLKTIIWTDTLQTAFMLLAVVLSIYYLGVRLDLGIGGMVNAIADSDYSQWFFFDDINSKQHFIKQFLGGMFVAIAMTGLDQDMMQKNLSCKDLPSAQKNMMSFSTVLIFVNVLFLALGALLFMYAEQISLELPEKLDHLYPMIARDGHIGSIGAVVFILGLVAAAYSSADSALAALTTSVCVDFVGVDEMEEQRAVRTRKWIHLGMSLVLLVVILIFNQLNEKSVIDELLTIAGYTYGPLLGLFAFGILTKRNPVDRYIPLVCILSPLVTYFIQSKSAVWFTGYQIGYELLIINALITCLGLWAFSLRTTNNKEIENGKI